MTIKKLQIYILDDDESVLRALKVLMCSYGFAVETFLSSEEFFAAVPSSATGCMILDIHMPGINGWDTQARLRKEKYTLPVIVISADKDDTFKEKSLKAGAVGFLQKPFEDHYLLHMVNKVFNIKNQEGLMNQEPKKEPVPPTYEDQPTPILKD